MNADEKYNNAVQIFHNYYDGENETLHVASSVLEENKLGVDFWDMICPKLQREGILKNWPSFIRGYDYINQSRANAIWESLTRLESLRSEKNLGKGIFNHLFVHDRHSISVWNTLKELEDNEHLLKQELDALERIYTFVVNGEKLEKYYLEISTPSVTNLLQDSNKNIGKPHCVEKYGIGYLKFNKDGEEIKIGGTNSQPYKLLRCLTEPFGNPKSINTVYEAIREGRRIKPTGIYRGEIDRAKKIQLIENSAIKEAQKGGKLRGKIKFEFDETKSKMWLEYTI